MEMLAESTFGNNACVCLSEDYIDVRIDHVFASGAVVGRATTHEWGRPSFRAPGDPTAPDAKTWPISILP